MRVAVMGVTCHANLIVLEKDERLLFIHTSYTLTAFPIMCDLLDPFFLLTIICRCLHTKYPCSGTRTVDLGISHSARRAHVIAVGKNSRKIHVNGTRPPRLHPLAFACYLCGGVLVLLGWFPHPLCR